MRVLHLRGIIFNSQEATMYENNELTKVLSSSTVAGVGIAALPNTGDNSLGMILSFLAIGIGITALVSQLVVRALRQRYSREQR